MEIIEKYQREFYLLVWLDTNEILLYKGITPEMLVENGLINRELVKTIDKFNPIAKFSPNIDGWALGKKLIEKIINP